MNNLDSLTIDQLACINGGIDWNRAIDNGVRWGSAGGFAGAGIGVFCGAGLFSAEGAGVGGALGGAGGLIAGTGYDVYQQMHGSKAAAPAPAAAAK